MGFSSIQHSTAYINIMTKMIQVLVVLRCKWPIRACLISLSTAYINRMYKKYNDKNDPGFRCFKMQMTNQSMFDIPVYCLHKYNV